MKVYSDFCSDIGKGPFVRAQNDGVYENLSFCAPPKGPFGLGSLNEAQQEHLKVRMRIKRDASETCQEGR